MKIARFHEDAAGRCYWKAEAKLRAVLGADGKPLWPASVPLGRDVAAARARAKDLNAEVEAWQKAELKRRIAGGLSSEAPKERRRNGPLTFGEMSQRWLARGIPRARPATVRTYTDHVKRLQAEFGDELAAGIAFERVDEWLERELPRAPGMARQLVATARLVFKWGIRKRLLPGTVNPFAEADVGAAKRRKVRIPAAAVPHIVAYLDHRGRSSLATGLVICFACIQRPGDVFALTTEHLVRGDRGEQRLQFHQSKGGRLDDKGELVPGFFVDMELPAVVARRLEKHAPAPARSLWDNVPRPLIVNEQTGEPWAYASRARTWRELRAEILDPKTRHPAAIAARAAFGKRQDHLAAMQLRDGRRSGFVQYVLDGNTVELVCSISGHSIEEGYDIVETYLPKTPDQADLAVAKLSVKW